MVGGFEARPRGRLRGRLPRLPVWLVALGVLAVAPVGGDGIIDEDFPPFFAYSAWSALRGTVNDSGLQRQLEDAILRAPLVAITSKAASSSTYHKVCLRFHFKGETESSIVRVYCESGPPSSWSISQIRPVVPDATPVPDPGVIAGDAGTLTALLAAVRHESLKTEVEKLMPQHGLRRIALVEASGAPGEERRFSFSFEFAPRGGCGTTVVTLLVEVIQDVAGATRTTALKRVGEGEGRG